jgi:hypothetical protein
MIFSLVESAANRSYPGGVGDLRRTQPMEKARIWPQIGVLQFPL